MSDFFVILDLQISHVLEYTPDFQVIETSNSTILNQTLKFKDRHYLNCNINYFLLMIIIISVMNLDNFARYQYPEIIIK
jgi:hypothetical protein